GEVLAGIEVMIPGTHVDVVDVQENPAVGALRHLPEKLPFGHLRVLERDVARDVLEQDAAPQHVLYFGDAFRDVACRELGEWERKEIVEVLAVHPGPAQMIRHPSGLYLLDQPLQTSQVVEAEWIGGPNVQGDSVQNHRV